MGTFRCCPLVLTYSLRCKTIFRQKDWGNIETKLGSSHSVYLPLLPLPLLLYPKTPLSWSHSLGMIMLWIKS